MKSIVVTAVTDRQALFEREITATWLRVIDVKLYPKEGVTVTVSD